MAIGRVLFGVSLGLVKAALGMLAEKIDAGYVLLPLGVVESSQLNPVRG